MTGSERPNAEGRAPKRSTPNRAFGIRHSALLLVWLFTAAVVWNGVFDLLITRGVKEYLYRQAEHDLGRGPAVTMGEIMDETVRDAAITASLWALFVGGTGVLTVYAGRRSAEPA